MTDMIGDDGCYRYSRPIFTMSSPTIQSPLQADKSSKQVQGNMPVALLSEPKKPRRNRRHAIEAATTLTPEASDASNQSSTSSPQSVVVSPRNEILPITPANATFDATPSGMPTPQSATAKAKRPEMVSDRDNIRVDSILEGIPDLKALDKVRLEQLLTTEAGQVQLDFKVSPKEFEKWKADKEEVGGYEYNYSREELIIKADGGAIHETTVHLMAWWFGNFAEGNGNLYMSLGEEFKLRDLVSGEKYTKRPDCFVRVGDQEFPRVIVEVGVTQTLDQLKRAARDWLLASNLVHLVFLIHVDKIDQVDGFNKILRSRKRRETPGRPNRYAQYKELLDGAEEDFDPAIYCDRRSYLYKKTAGDLAKVFAGTDNDVKSLEKEVDAWHKQKFELYKVNSVTFYIYDRSSDSEGEFKPRAEAVYWTPQGCTQDTLDELSGTINTGDLFDDGANEPVTLPTVPLRQRVDAGIKRHIQQQIRVIVEDLETAHKAWEQQKLSNEGAPPEDATTKNPRPNSRYSFRDIPDDGLASGEPPSSDEDGSRLETRASIPAVNRGQKNLQGLPPQIGAVAPEELMPQRKRGRVSSGFSRGLETAKRLRDRVVSRRSQKDET